jgi:hypothetical protein
MVFATRADAERVLEVLGKRLAKYGLTLHPKETRLLDSRRPRGAVKPGTFVFLGTDLMRRVYRVEVLVCPHCGGPRRLLAAVHDPVAIRRILVAMGQSPDLPARSPPRGTAGTVLPR